MRLVLTLALLAASPPPDAQPPSSDPVSAVQSAIGEAFGRDGTAGVSVGVVRSGSLASQRHLGFADVAARRPPDARTIYRVASVTKAFTALMYLQLVERGSVRPTDPVTRYVPEASALLDLPEGSAPPTLVQLATHTSGLAAEPEGEGFDRGPAALWERRTVDAISHVHFVAGPGTRYGYSNYGYALLALALTRAAGEPYVQYVRVHITGPLGMSDTGFKAVEPARLAQGYTVANAAAAAIPDEDRGYKLPVGGLYTTLADLARFVAFQMGDGPEGVLKRKSLEDASRGLITVDRSMGEAYGTGFQLFTNGGTVLQGHGGGMPGWRALEVFDRRSKLGFVVLRNATGGKFGDPAVAILGALPSD